MSESPLLSIRIPYCIGSASDPIGKEGLVSLTARLIAKGATSNRSYKQILDAFFEMATGFEAQIDQEQTIFIGVVHCDHATRYESLIREMLDTPAFLEEDLERVRDELLNALQVELRGSNDEELAKEMLQATVFEGHPYGHPCIGTVEGLKAITIADVTGFYERLKSSAATNLPAPRTLQGIEAVLIDKPSARGTALSFGHPIAVTRGHKDYLALLIAQGWLGQHRNGGRLFDVIRELRGLSYGAYAYIEYFPRGMFQVEPDPNLARRHQLFEVWLRPVDPSKACFALKLALHEIATFQRDGMTQDDFERTRNFLTKYVKLLVKTESLKQGYAIDSEFYGIGEYTSYIEEGLRRLTLEDVNRAARQHIDLNRFCLVAVGPEMTNLATQLNADTPATIEYEIEHPGEVLATDRLAASYPLQIMSLKTISFEDAFER